MQHGDAAYFGLAVYLLEVDSDRVEKAEDVGAERCASRVTAFDACQSELVSHRPQCHLIGDGPQDVEPEADGFSADLTARYLVADVVSPAEDGTREPAGFVDADVDLLEHRLRNHLAARNRA